MEVRGDGGGGENTGGDGEGDGGGGGDGRGGENASGGHDQGGENTGVEVMAEAAGIPMEEWMEVTAESISSKGSVIASSSKPCMVRFRSLPVQLMRTFITAIPLLLGMCSESQTITLELLRYKESSQKPTEFILVTLKPRSGTYDLPQIYEAEVFMDTQLPWRKEIVYNWRWTVYVWISLYVYVLLIIVLVCCSKPFAFFRRASYRAEKPPEIKKEDLSAKEGEFSAALRRWHERSRRKKKVGSLRAQPPEMLEGSASSVTGGGEMGEVIDDSGDFAVSESSVCVGG